MEPTGSDSTPYIYLWETSKEIWKLHGRTQLAWNVNKYGDTKQVN